MTQAAPLTSAQRMLIASVVDLCVDLNMKGEHDAHAEYNGTAQYLAIDVYPAGMAGPATYKAVIDMDSDELRGPDSDEARRQITRQLAEATVALKRHLTNGPELKVVS